MLGPVPESALEGIRVNAVAPREILHVGSTIQRKRIDVLLRVFAGLRKTCRTARLVRVSGPFTADQAALASELKVAGATTVLPFVEPATLAAIYRRAALVLITSDHEGFGLPLIEAMACGAPVIASDLAVLREVGGAAADFIAVGDVPAWIAAAQRVILHERANDADRWSARRSGRISSQAAKYSWSEYARRYLELYGFRLTCTGDNIFDSAADVATTFNQVPEFAQGAATGTRFKILNMKSSIADEGAAAQTLGREPPAETLAPMRPGQSRRQSEAAGLSRLRVLHLGKFYPPYRGGIESHLHALCRELIKSINVNVIVANETRRLRESEVDGVAVRRLPRLFNLWATPICPTLVREIRGSDADIVHLHLPNPLAALAYLASGHKGRLVIAWHSDIVRQKTIARMLRPLDDALLSRASALIASSPNYIDSSPILSRNRERCRVIPYGIDADAFRPRDTETAAKIRERYGPRLVLAVGRMVHYKGFEYLIRAMAGVRGHLLLVGEGPLLKKLERQAFDAGATDRITFLGRVSQEEMIGYLHASDVFVMPSIARSEAFGIAQLEAMACGKPVVNTRLQSGVPSVSIDGETGVTVGLLPTQTPLAAAINRLLDDPALRGKFGAAAARRAREEFSVEMMVDRTLDLYREVMANGRIGVVAAP